MRKTQKGNIELQTESASLYKRIESYSSEGIYPETNIDRISIKLMNYSDGPDFVVSYADYISSGIITGKWSTYDDPGDLSPQKHEGFELLIPVENEITEFIQGESHKIYPGDIFLSAPDCETVFYPDIPSIIINLSFTTGYLLDYYQKNQHLQMFPPLIRSFFLENMSLAPGREHNDFLLFRGGGSISPSIKNISNSIYEEMCGRKPGYEQILDGMTLRLFHLLADPERFRVETGNVQKIQGTDLAERVKEYLDHEKRKIPARELAEIFHFNASYLSKVFQAQMQQSLKSYNESVYMREIHRLLSTTDLSITEIASRTGFSSRSQLYKAFQDYYHVPIQSIRKQS